MAWYSKMFFILPLRYTIVSGDKTADFSIGESSGVLRVNRQLDFERKNAYQLTIQVTDGQGDMEREYF
jgi:protocadherin Fat 4